MYERNRSAASSVEARSRSLGGLTSSYDRRRRIEHLGDPWGTPLRNAWPAFGATSPPENAPQPMIKAHASADAAAPVAEPCAGFVTDADLETLTPVELNFTPETPADGILLDDAARPPRRRGYCRCSCGYPCETSADCGGASCDKFITCC